MTTPIRVLFLLRAGPLCITRPVCGQSIPDTALVARRLPTVNLTYLGVALAQEHGLGRRTTLRYGVGGHCSF